MYRYNSVTVAKFINNVMQCGKKSLAEQIVYQAMDIAAERTKKNALDVFEQAIREITPLLEVRPRRVGGATYQVPVEIRKDRQQALAFRWLIDAARQPTGQDNGRETGEVNCSTRIKALAQPSKRKKIRTGWLMPTRHLHITAGSKLYAG